MLRTAGPLSHSLTGNQLGEAHWAAAVAGFAQILKGGKYTGGYSYDDVIALARGAKGEDTFGYRAEFINVVRLAGSASALPNRWRLGGDRLRAIPAAAPHQPIRTDLRSGLISPQQHNHRTDPR